MSDDKARQRAVDQAVEHLVSLTCLPCQADSGCWSGMYRDDVELLAAEIAEFRAIEKLADEQLTRLRAVADAAERVSAQWESMHHCYQSTEESVVLADLLDALVARMPEEWT